MLLHPVKSVLALAICALGCSQPGLTQVAPPSIIRIDINNYVPYHFDVFDASKIATTTAVTTPPPDPPFLPFVHIGDVVAVNGVSVKGLWTARATTMAFTPTPAAKSSIADAVRGTILDMYLDLYQQDGTPVGTIMAIGLARGAPPPGSPGAQTSDSLTIVGGTGAFVGARGQAGLIDPGSPRQASVTEDPASRRINGGAKRSYVLQLFPMSLPQIATAAGGPAITHSSDFTPVTTSKPAVAGEILSLFATGLGPTRPAVDVGQPFPASPPAVVNSPVEVRVNGKSAEIIAAVGFPGAVDGYQVNFRVPSGVAKGAATIQVSAAWITGPGVTIAIQ